ncbi:hypothetical protein [Gottfriedia solisilvae]|uniref:Uncharacterized protein n=1 Tax=Gottfriedia solisilvae TaxID=1516104 RepID=A0A8J3AFF2_9BACI|nr:hypothetical protein [Gottfriedia solisilvae]GGI11516.1 hypothetical protein GCM10007380_08230 [Gottfriedia solisilvae]
MSLATYLGCNFNVEITDKVTNEPIEIGYIFSEENNRRDVQSKHFSTQNVYEIELPNPIWQINHYQKKNYPRNYKKSQRDFISLCDLLKQYLKPGEYCEIYPCWLGEELEPNESECTIQLDNYNIDKITIYEKCLVRIEK